MPQTSTVTAYRFLYLITLVGIVLLGIYACGSASTDGLFKKIDPKDSGIHFSNRISENDTMNILTFEYINNGGGVAMADFNNDSLVDVYFTGNHVANQLYLNDSKTNQLHFKDITKEAKVTGEGRWCSGVAVVDINQDNLMDIYVCTTARKSASQRANLLYVNQGVDAKGVPHFKEMAQEYGLADTTHSTQAAFFDYDNDGDLDVYIAVNEMADVRFPNMYHPRVSDGSSPLTDKLYRNDWNPTLKHAVFTDVSHKEGILFEGFGLGINITDINQDGWKDVYITNDYLTNDLLYINQHENGKHTGFKDEASLYFKHTSHSAMGNDVTDINNDGLVDILALDMMPEDNYRKKMMTLGNNYQAYQNNEKFGYVFQYPRNTLQLNRGINPYTHRPVFSEIGLLTGLAESDWSWTPLVTDFDNDGLRDVIITNGFPQDITDQDFMVYRAEVGAYAAPVLLLDLIPSVKVKNKAYRNKGNLQFEEVTESWGITEPSFSNGAAYADLDNDGDLDYIINNINDSASVFCNNVRQQLPEKSNYLRLKFVGNASNKNGLGATVKAIYGKGEQQFYENTPYRGYLSSVETGAHFGLGSHKKIDQLIVTWSSGLVQTITNVPANQQLVVYESQAKPATKSEPNTGFLFTKNQEKIGKDFVHEEEDFIDFNVQKLIPHKLSQLGPCIAVGDVNQDGLEDFYMGSSLRRKGIFGLQRPDGSFEKKDLLPEKAIDKNWEEMGALLFDLENDGDLDLYVVSGSNELPVGDNGYQDHIYINQGKGKFVVGNGILPSFLKSGSCVKACDFDHDGDLDLFIGGRVEPNKYPKATNSYILRNEAPLLKFSDVTATQAPALKGIGLVCDALWTDYDNDGWEDLLLAGEWMSPTFLKNNKGRLQNTSSADLQNFKGFWNSIVAGDFDNDGDIDYVLGNQGENTLYRASDDMPVRLYHGDFNTDGSYDAIPTVYLKDTLGKRQEFPFNTRDDMVKQMIQTRKRFDKYHKYAKATIHEVFTPSELSTATILSANWTKTSYVENLGKGSFKLKALPTVAQFSSVNAMLVADWNADGNLDLLLSGNDYGNEISIGRLDAGMGEVLLGDGKGSFNILPLAKTGLCLDGDTKALVMIPTAKAQIGLLNSQNRGALREIFLSQKPTKIIPLQAKDQSAIVWLKNGKKRKEEFYYGNTYLSQSARNLYLNSSIKQVQIVNSNQQKRVY